MAIAFKCTSFGPVFIKYNFNISKDIMLKGQVYEVSLSDLIDTAKLTVMSWKATGGSSWINYTVIIPIVCR